MSMANPYFPEYQSHNPGIVSFFDDLTVALSPGKRYSQCSVSYTVLRYHIPDRTDPLYVDATSIEDQTFADRLSHCSFSVNNTLMRYLRGHGLSTSEIGTSLTKLSAYILSVDDDVDS